MARMGQGSGSYSMCSRLSLRRVRRWIDSQAVRFEERLVADVTFEIVGHRRRRGRMRRALHEQNDRAVNEYAHHRLLTDRITVLRRLAGTKTCWTALITQRQFSPRWIPQER